MNKKFNLTLLSVAVATSWLATPSFAQGGLEEVIVTAQKREQSLQDVPISVAVLGAEMLATRGIDTLTDIGANVPNLYVNPVNNTPTSVRIFIRGIGQNDVQLTQDPSVALYLDGVYIGTSIGAGFEGVDVKRLEILRGPQGTLYGRNASGGAVNIITRRASVDAIEFRQDLTVGNLGIFKANTVINVPVSEKAAIKLNYFHTEREELVENKGAGENFGMKDNDSVVVDIRFDATDTFSMDYRYEKARGDSSQRLQQTTQTSDSALSRFTEITQVSDQRLDDVTPFREIAQNDLETDAHTLFLTWEASDSLTVKSITAWRELDNTYFSDSLPTAVGDYTLRGRGAGAPSYGVSEAAFKQFSQEIQLLGSTDNLEYVAGLYYYRDESSQDAAGSSSLGVLRPTDYSEAENESLAAFGQFTYIPQLMNQRWQITVGARYSADNRKAFRDNASVGFIGHYDEDFDNFTPSLAVSFDINDDMNAYGKVVSGFRSGGTSQRSANEELFASGFDEEEISAMSWASRETSGIKEHGSTWLPSTWNWMGCKPVFRPARHRVNGSAGQRDFLPIDENTIKGFEFDFTLLLAEGLSLRFDYGYLDTELGEQSIDSPVGSFDLVDVMSYAPKNSYTASLDYSLPVSNGILDFNLNYAYKDEVSTSINTRDNTIIADYAVLGAAVTWSDISLGSVPGALKVIVWGKNLDDEEYGIISTAAWGVFGASEATTFGDPRSYDITLSYNF